MSIYPHSRPGASMWITTDNRAGGEGYPLQRLTLTMPSVSRRSMSASP